MALFILGIIPGLNLLLLDWRQESTVRWVEELWSRKTNLVRHCESTPRLLVAGGSSGLFSVDAELIEARLAMPAFNVSTHAGLGLRFLLDDIRALARKGDVVLLYFEYQHYRNKPAALTELERKVLWTNRPWRLRTLPVQELARQIYANPWEDYRDGWTRLNRRMAARVSPSSPAKNYSSIELGPCGDFRASMPLVTTPLVPVGLEPMIGVEKNAGKLLHAFFLECKKRGIRLIAARPGMLRTIDAPPGLIERAYESVASFYSENGIPLLDTKEVFQLPRELFFDTPYHATAAGRRLITEALARQLAPRLNIPTGSGGDSALFLVASATSVVGRDLATSAPPACRFVFTEALDHPLCITPEQARRMQAAGSRLVFAEPEVKAMLEGAGLSCTLTGSKLMPLGEWLRQFPHHLLAMSVTGPFDGTAIASEFPEPMCAFVGHPSVSRVALFGTGRYAGIALCRMGEVRAELELAPDEEPLARLPFPMAYALYAGPPDPPRVSIRIQHFAIGSETTPGLAIAVIDPEAGRVVDYRVVSGRQLTEWQRWEAQAPPDAL